MVCISQFITSYNSNHSRVSPSEENIYKLCNNFDRNHLFVLFFFFSMVLIESVRSVRVTLLAMTLWSSTMLFLFIMVSRQKKDSTLLRMKKITVTETFLERLKRNSSWSILSRPDNVKKNVYCQRKIWKGWLGLLVCVKRLAAVD